jgi:hypothetical protein
VELLIDSEGESLRWRAIAIDEAVWNRGYIHIRTIGHSLMVALSPSLASAVAKVAAFYEIADLDPERIFLNTAGAHGKFEVFCGLTPVIRRVHELAVAAGTEACYPILPEDNAGVYASIVAARVD